MRWWVTVNVDMQVEATTITKNRTIRVYWKRAIGT
jgi:hypothetical protein